MREILFRGKSIVANTPSKPGYWMEGNLFHQTRSPYGETVNCYHIFDGNEFIEGPDHETELWPETIGQFTGLTDKNGKKIFEGDIVKTKYGRLCIVVWFLSQEYNGWDLEPIRTFENCVRTKPPESIDLYKKDNLEVIGNIHDNPELMR